MSCRIPLYLTLSLGVFAAGHPSPRAMSATVDEWFDTSTKMPLEENATHGSAALTRLADAGMPHGVRLTRTSPAQILNQGHTTINTLDRYNALAGQKIRIQNGKPSANYSTKSFGGAIAAVPCATYPQVNAEHDDASWAQGTQLQTAWPLSSERSHEAPVENGCTTRSKGITYAQQGALPGTPHPSASSDARWSLLRSIPNIGPGGTVTFEIDKTNYALTSPTALRIGVIGSAGSAGDSDFTRGLNSAITAALTPNVSYDPQSGTLIFGPKMVFPFSFAMTAARVVANKDYVLAISNSQVGQIDVAQAGVRLGVLATTPVKPRLGLNEASGEFSVGDYNFKYAYPGKDRLDWAAEQGFGMIRVPFLFQNVQASSSAPLNEAAMRHLDEVLNECAVLRIVCLLDMHNYGSYYLDNSAASQGLPGSIGASNHRLANLWAQIAARYKSNSYVWFDLMNEPNKQTALEWVKTANTIAAAIRATGATNKIIFQGTAWDGAWTWVTSGNATQLLKAYDPGNNYAFEAHQYLDRDGSGTSSNCLAGSGATRIDPFTTWLQTHRLQGILGEVGWAANAGCTNEATALLRAWQAATTSTDDGGYIGLTYWAAGPWWPDGYMYLAEPRPFPTGAEPPQLITLKNYLSH